MTEFQRTSRIANYLGYKQNFEQHTSDIQASLKACGWKWVAMIISEYGEDHRYQHFLASPRMYESLEFEPIEWSDIDDGRPVWDSVLDSKWVENVDYILF